MPAEPLLMPDAIVRQTFGTTRFRAGYDADEVDVFLDAVVATMRATLAGAQAHEHVTAAEVAAVTFTPTRFRDGYATDEVDVFLDRVRATLEALERGQRPG